MKDSKYKVVVVILLVVIICLGGYIVYGAINDKNNQTTDNEVNENNNTNNNENKVVSYDLKKAEELVANYYFGESGLLQGFINLSYEHDKLYVAIRNSEKIQISCKEAYKDNKEFKYYAEFEQEAVKSGEEYFYCPEKPMVINYSDLNYEYQKLFGSNKNVPKDNLSYGFGVIYYYDATNSRFIESEFHGGGARVSFNFYTLKTAEIINNELVIKVGYADVKPSESGSQIELANGSMGNLENEMYENSNEEIKQEVFSKYKEQLKIKTFTFELDNGNYVLKNIEG